MAMITQASLNALRVTFRNDYAKAYSLAQNWYDKVSTTIPSTTKLNTYGWAADLPIMREWANDERKVQNVKEMAYNLINRKFELTYAVLRDDIEDDTLGLYTQQFSNLGMQAKKHPDLLMRDTIQAGQNTACFDGLSFFNTAHPVDIYDISKGTYSNYSASGMALTPQNYETVRALMMGYKGTSGVELGIMPNILLVPPQLEITARRIVQSDMIPSAAGTAPEQNMLKGTADIVVAPELSNQGTRWYLLCTNRGIMPFVYQLRQAAEFTMLTQLTDANVFNLDEYRFGSRIRDNGGYSLPFLAYSASA
jgi:phage major head subunit gpT-like protein